MKETLVNWLMVAPSETLANMPNWVQVCYELLMGIGNVFLFCLLIAVLIDMIKSMMNSNRVWWFSFIFSCFYLLVAQLIILYYK